MTGDFFSSTTPLHPPTTEDERFQWLRLLRCRRVGPTTFRRLMMEHGSADVAMAALPEIAAQAGVDDYTLCPENVIAAEVRAARQANARMICLGDALYPEALAELPDAPPILWVVGDAAQLQKPLIAMVGARNASSLGTRMARALAKELGAAGYVVVSGLARGVDTSAHLGALKSGTIAVMAGGVDVIYPSENRELASDIIKTGALLSEQPVGLPPKARHFRTRNRIISGLARAVVVVEAAAKSGSLITARDALDQGREVLAVPGHPFDARAAGCNMLIRDGSHLVRNAEDVIAALPPEPARRAPVKPRIEDIPKPPPERRSLQQTIPLHQQILDRLGPSPVAEDQLLRDLDASPQHVAPALVDLELDGQIQRRSGGLLTRLPNG